MKSEDVLISIRGLHALAETPQEDIEVIFPAVCRKLGDTWYVQYTEPVEGMDGEIRNLIKLRSDGIEVTKKGLTSTHMIFEPGKRTSTWYETPLGSIALGITATEVSFRETEYELEASAVYALEIEDQHTADCMIRIRVFDKMISSLCMRKEPGVTDGNES